MDVITVILFCIASSVLISTVGVSGNNIKLLCSIAAASLVAIRFLSSLSYLTYEIRSVIDVSGIDDSYYRIMFKCLGICFITQFGCDCCRELGENAIADQLLIFGKVSLLITSLPLYSAAVDLIRSLILF